MKTNSNTGYSYTLFLCAICAAAVAGACDDDDQRAPIGEPSPSVEEVAEAPASYIGRAVILSGEVDEVEDDMRSFELQSQDDPFELWEEELLVVTRSPIQMPGGPLEDDDDVIVTGKVQSAAATDFKEQLGWDPGPRFTGDRPVVVADSVVRIDEREMWSEGSQPAIVGYTVITSMVPLSSLANHRVSIERVPVRSVAERALWVGHAHTNQLLVVPSHAGEIEGIEAGHMVAVEGTLQTMPAADEAIQRFGLSRQLRGQISQEPLYLAATSIKRVERAAAGAGANPANPVVPNPGDDQK